MMKPDPWKTHTMQLAFQDICKGEQPWIALGNFLNYWFEYARDRRSELIAEAISEAPQEEYYQRWAAFCAASVEHLCNKYGVPCPEWAYDSKYVLSEPWYCDPMLSRRDRLIATTPEEFRKRNVCSGSSRNMFANKWELAEKYREKARQFYHLSKSQQVEYWKTGKMPIQ